MTASHCLLVFVCFLGVGCDMFPHQEEAEPIAIHADSRPSGGGQTISFTDQFGNVIGSITIPPSLATIKHAMVWAEVDGQRVRLLVDTGAETTVIYQPPGWFQSHGVHPDGLSSGVGGMQVGYKIVYVGRMRVGDKVVSNWPVSVIEFPNYLMRPFDGLLGADFLFRFKMTLDYANNEMLLIEPDDE